MKTIKGKMSEEKELELKRISAFIECFEDFIVDFLKENGVISCFAEPAAKTFVDYWFGIAKKYRKLFIINEHEEMVNRYLCDLRKCGAKGIELSDLVVLAIIVQNAALNFLSLTEN